MLSAIGRRLALLNTLVVVAVIAVVGITTVVLMRTSLDAVADQMLAERAMVGRERWADRFAQSGASAPASGNTDAGVDDEFPMGNDQDGDDEAHELLASGDILLLAVNTQGQVIANARGLDIPGLPDPTAVTEALAGRIDTRNGQIGVDGVRIYTEPIWIDGQVRGAVQTIRSRHELEEELRIAGWVSVVGVGLGAVIALPVGLFLSRRALRPIEVAFERQRAFVADASHELRTPLTLMRATTEMVQRLPDASPMVREELDGVLDEIDATNRLVGDLLLLASLDSTELPLHQDVGDLGALVRETVSTILPLVEAAGLQLTLETEPGLIVQIDRSRIAQVLRVLLGNAIAYTPTPGHLRVAVMRQGNRPWCA